MATPVVELSIETPVTDENFFRNGNFYSSFWHTPAGLSCPVGVETFNADYWSINPNGAAVTCKRSTDVPDLYSLWSMEVDGAAGVTDCSVAQQISGDLSATLRRACTFSGYIENNSGSLLSPTLEVWTANAFNDFTNVTLQTTVNLQSVPIGTWGYDTVTIDLSTSTLLNVANGLLIKVRLPNGALSQPSYRINFSRLKFQLGEVATNFVDDPSLFILTPSVDSTMLQDGCIARASLFLPNVVPKGAYQAASIQTGDIGAGQVTATNMAAGATVGNLGYTPVNKAGDVNVGIVEHDVDTLVGATAPAKSGVFINGSSVNASNDVYFPAIGFGRPGVVSRAIGLKTDRSFITVDDQGTLGHLLDSIVGVDTASIQDQAVTLQKLSTALVNLIIPPGIMQAFAGPNIPTGWLACDGRAVLRSTYPNLFAAIGTYWGAGDNITTFNLPDLRGRAVIGYVNSAITGITGRAFGSRGGEEVHTLSGAELAAHNHNISDPQHYHPVADPSHSHGVNDPQHFHAGVKTGALTVNGTGNTAVASAQNANTSYASTGITLQAATTGLQVGSAPTGISIQNFGGNAAHNNMQPFGVAYYIIKT